MYEWFFALHFKCFYLTNVKVFLAVSSKHQRNNNRKGSPRPVGVAWFMPLHSQLFISLCPRSLWFCRLPSCFSFLWVPSKSLINISCNSFVSCSDCNLLILPRCHAKCSGAAGPATTAHDSAPRTEELDPQPQGSMPALATHSFQAQGTALCLFLFFKE